MIKGSKVSEETKRKQSMKKKSRNIDKLKDKIAQDNNYNLLRVWEDELDNLDQYCKIFGEIL